MLAKDILTKARFSLSDTSKSRWSDIRLLGLLNEAVREIAKKTTIFVENTFVVLNDGTFTLDMKEVSTKIIRVEYLDNPVEFITMDEMDRKFGKDWQQHKNSKVKALVYTNQVNSQLRIYPIVENAVNNNITYSSPFGVVTDISYSEILPVMSNHFGDISGIPDDALLKVFYVRKHELITDINQVLNIDDLCEVPIIHFIVGRALRDNQDTQNRAMSLEELAMFENLLSEYDIEKSKNFVRPSRTTRYNPLGD